VSVIDTATNTVIGSRSPSAPTREPWRFTPDGSKVYVANRGDNTGIM